MLPTEDTLSYTYQFELGESQTKSFELELDVESLQYQGESDQRPEWTKLEHHQCPNCPLSAEEHPHCPVAVNMVEPLAFFRDRFSYEEADVTIKADTRSYFKKSAIQEALGSLFGIIMVTSGCPLLDKLRPMVRMHLPFASIRENVYRVISMYCTAQFFRERNGMEASHDLDGLVSIYQDIETVNQAFRERISSEIKKDANVNALLILNCMAQSAVITIEQNYLDEIEKNFEAYLK